MGIFKLMNSKQQRLYEALCYESYRWNRVIHKLTNRELALLAGIPESKIGDTRNELADLGLIKVCKLSQAYKYTLCDPATQQPLTNKALGEREDKIHYVYENEDDEPAFRVVRYGEGFKKYQTQVPDGEDWKVSKGGFPELIYSLPQVREADFIFVTEGERDVHTFFNMNLEDDSAYPIAATCNPGGARNWRDAHAAFLRDKVVFICGDNDPTGRIYVEKVRASLQRIAKEIRVVTLPDEYEDISHYMETNTTKDFLMLLKDDRLEEKSQKSPRMKYFLRGKKGKSLPKRNTSVLEVLWVHTVTSG